MIIRFAGWVIIVQLVISVIYSLMCVGYTVDEFLSAKYGDKWKRDEISEAEKEIAIGIYKQYYPELFNETIKIFLIMDIVVAIGYWWFF